MIELSNMLWLCAIFGAVIGFQRGWNKELVSLAGIVLGMFALFQFDGLLRGTLLALVGADQVFFVQLLLFAAIVYYSYQAPANLGQQQRRPTQGESRRDRTDNLLGGVAGFFNGYLIWGTIWYFLDINEYPLSPYIIAPAPGSASDQALGLLPMVIAGGGVSGTGDYLSAAVIVVLLLVLVVM
jgi:Colicin V production protein